MFEKLFHREQVAEKTPEIPLDKTLFGRLEGLLGTFSRRDGELLGEALDSIKRKSFGYMEETLDEILKEDSGTDEESKKRKEHDIANGFAAIKTVLLNLNIPHNWPSEREKALAGFKTAALSYALERGLEYEKRVFGNHEDTGKVLKEMQLATVVEPGYLNDHIVKKVDALPVEIRDNLLAV